MDTKNGSPDLEQGNSRKQSESYKFTRSESREKEAISKYKCILQTWANKITMLPFDIINGVSACFPYHLFLLMLMLGFYSSVTGIILWPNFPKAATGFYLVAFLCILMALTILFASLLPSNLKDVPWICLTFVSLIVFGLAVYEECRLNYVSMEKQIKYFLRLKQ